MKKIGPPSRGSIEIHLNRSLEPQAHGSLMTRRWSKGDSNSWSHPEGQRSGSAGLGSTWWSRPSYDLAAARARGRKCGSPAKLTPKQVCTARKMLADPE